MRSTTISRRDFVKGSASSLALLALPGLALGQATPQRLEWQQFKSTPQYASFLYAIAAMRANTNAASPLSWLYWTNMHVNYCPHEIAYFLAWHRGYLYYFEQQLRQISQDNALRLPYWDYYARPAIPSEFLDPAAGNPLYVQRINTNVYNALDLAPFAAGVFNFQRGTSNGFEAKFESAPHNPIHNIIGGYMADMQSPMDPIFYLHHANIDRLWHAWALPDGKGIPGETSSYWNGAFTYASGLTLARSQTYYPALLGVVYANNNKPSALPPQAQAAHVFQVQAQMDAIWRRPPAGRFPASPPRAISRTRRSVGGVTGVALDENSVSAHVPLAASDAETLRDLLARIGGAPLKPAPRYQSVRVVFDQASVTPAGKSGGYFYNVYLNLPDSGDATPARQRHFLGTLGPFELAGAAHHGPASLGFAATDVLTRLDAAELSRLTVSLVRVNGANTPKGETIRIGEVRIELSTEEPWLPAESSSREKSGYR